ncbi:MAG: hypothetical protein EOO53_00695 [Gammaproteobacteria bacterium]|nr:MAG: hypothetical protein EOO53_00695 [Gammaproteobacteria bacterium]
MESSSGISAICNSRNAEKVDAEAKINAQRRDAEAKNKAVRDAEIARQQENYQAEQQRIAIANRIKAEVQLKRKKSEWKLASFGLVNSKKQNQKLIKIIEIILAEMRE